VVTVSVLTHYVTVTCDLACETFDRPSNLIYLATTAASFIKEDVSSTVVPHLKTTTPIAMKKRAGGVEPVGNIMTDDMII